MPTSYSDQFYVMDPGNPPDPGTSLTPSQFSFIDQNNDGRISSSNNDSFDGSDITAIWVNDVIRVTMDGSAVTIRGVTFYTADGRAVFTPNDGTILKPATFNSSSWVTNSTNIPVGQLGPPCFAAGTMIETEAGPKPVEQLEVGDRVLTRDHGMQPILWTGHRRTDGTGDFAPIRFAPGALDNERQLLVSPQHRMVITGWRAELFFGEDEVLVAAKHLVNGDTIHRLPVPQVDYHHFLCDEHEIVLAEGLLSESFHPGDYIMMADAGIRDELLALFPELDPVPGKGGRVTARRVLRAVEAQLL